MGDPPWGQVNAGLSKEMDSDEVEINMGQIKNL